MTGPPNRVWVIECEPIATGESMVLDFGDEKVLDGDGKEIGTMVETTDLAELPESC